MARIVVDGRAHEVGEGRNLLEACLAVGVEVPFFCWHPALGSVGACRQCAVRAGGRIAMACMTPASDGLEVSVADPEAADFRRSNVEWLMRNHPHDCPVCDEGGECHLQDMTVLVGHDHRRDRFQKRTHRSQDLGPLVHHEMNRCIQCYRCVRFYARTESTDLAVFGCHDDVFFGRREDGVLESAFSGNLVEICPTGVFTDRPQRRHFARKWDLQQAPAVCPHCAVGCNLTAGARTGVLRRVRNRYNAAVNGWFLCDRGRFGPAFVDAPSRLRAPRDRSGALAIDEARARLADTGDAIGIGSPRASLEANLALKLRVGPGRFFAGVPARELSLLNAAIDLYRAVPAASVRDAEEADAVLVLGEDVLNTAPRLFLALRQAARNGPRAHAAERLGLPAWHDQALTDAVGAEVGPVFVWTPAPTALDDLAREVRRVRPDEIVQLAVEVATGRGPAAEALSRARRPVVVTGLSLGSRALLEVAAAAARAVGARLAIVAPECDSLGLALLADRGLEDAMASGAPAAVVVEDDLFRRTAPGPLGAWLAGLRELVVLDAIETPTAALATLALPCATFAEGTGTYVSAEGRAQRSFPVLEPDGPLDAWRWLQPRWERHDDALAALAEVPELRGAALAAPPAAWRSPSGERVPRLPARASGRTALHLPPPPEDRDGPLAFSMEGSSLPPPHPLRTVQGLPGWNTEMALVLGPSGTGLDASGVRLLEPDGRPVPLPSLDPAPAGRWLVLEAHLVHGTEELSTRALAVASLVPAPYLEVIVYAGAVVVLFVFVVLLLGQRPARVAEERAWTAPRAWVGPAVLATVLLAALLPALPPGGAAVAVAPEAVGLALYGPWALAVEAASFLLLAALVGALHVARAP